MPRISFSLSILALLTAGASPALSEALAADIWAEWQAQAALSGQVVTATVTETDTGLTLTDISMAFEQDGVSTSATLGQVDMIENADGTLSMEFSDTYSMVFTFSVEPGDPPGNIELLLTHENLDVTVSGDPGNRTYDYTADRILITEGRIWGGGSEPPVIDLEAEVIDLAATYNLTGTGDGTDPMRFTSGGNAARIAMVLDVMGPPDEPGRLKAGFYATEIESASQGSVLSLAALNESGGQFPPGLELSGSTSYGEIGFEMAFEDPTTEFEVAYSNAGGQLAVQFSDQAIGYDISASGMTTRLSGSDLPVPAEFAVGSSELQLSVPLAAGPDPQEVSARIAYRDVTMSDTLWTMFDPGQAIPRDPASVVMDATGLVQIVVDLLSIDPESMTAAPPGELRALTVNELQVSVGGAELSGTANLTFAPNQVTPVPVGGASLRLSGGNALLDALMAGGLVPNEQGAFVRGAANVFGRPGTEPDTLESEVIFAEDGTITANGIPLQ